MAPYKKRRRVMIKENMTAKKSRYLSVRNGGEEMYVEDIPSTGRMRDHLPAAKLRLRGIQRVMPLGKWSITIEQQWKEGGVTHFQMLDVSTGELRESVR